MPSSSIHSQALVATAAELRAAAEEPMCIVFVVVAVLASLAISAMGAGAVHAGPQCVISRAARSKKDEGEGVVLVASAAARGVAEEWQY
jgi:hypothetical protein